RRAAPDRRRPACPLLPRRARARPNDLPPRANCRPLRGPLPPPDPARAASRPLGANSALTLFGPLRERLLDLGFEEETRAGLLAEIVGLLRLGARLLEVTLGRQQRRLDPEVEPVLL